MSRDCLNLSSREQDYKEDFTQAYENPKIQDKVHIPLQVLRTLSKNDLKRDYFKKISALYISNEI